MGCCVNVFPIQKINDFEHSILEIGFLFYEFFASSIEGRAYYLGFKQFRASSNKFGLIQKNSDKLKQIHTEPFRRHSGRNSDKHGLIRTNLIELSQIWYRTKAAPNKCKKHSEKFHKIRTNPTGEICAKDVSFHLSFSASPDLVGTFGPDQASPFDINRNVKHK